MKTITAALVAVSALAYGATALPAGAQISGDYSPPKLVRRAAPTKPIAGNGLVVLQVLVNPDGSHQVTKIIRSTNSGDNDAATEIAANSTYSPARQGSKAIKGFYDFSIRFNGRSVASDENSSGSSSIESLIRGGKYSQAKAAANSALLSSPGNPRNLQLLGAANYFMNDFSGAAAAFSRVPSIDHEFSAIAAQSLANAAAAQAKDNPQQSLEYAQRAVQLDSSTNSRFALGVAQIANGQNAAGIATLKSVRQALFNDSKATMQTKVNVDSHLLQAYLAANDTADAQATQAEIAKLDPNGGGGGAVVMANHYLQLATDAQKNKNYDEALKDYEQAATAGPKAAVTAYTDAAFAVIGMEKPDYKRAKAYADKALAADPNDPGAMFAEGASMAALWATGSHSDSDKAAAVAELNKADAQAKAAGNDALALQIETFLKNNIK